MQSSERKDKKEGELDFFFFFFLHGERSLDLDISLDVQIESALESIQDYIAPNLNSPNNFRKIVDNFTFRLSNLLPFEVFLFKRTVYIWNTVVIEDGKLGTFLL